MNDYCEDIGNYANKVTVTNSTSHEKDKFILNIGDILLDEDGDPYIFAVNNNGYVITSLEDGIHYEDIFKTPVEAAQFIMSNGFKVYRGNEINIKLGKLIL